MRIVNVGRSIGYRFLAYKHPRPGWLGRLGVLQHFYASVAALVVVELPRDERRVAINADLIDYFRVSTDGGVLQICVTPDPERFRSADQRATVFTHCSDRLITHEITPLLRAGAFVQLLLHSRALSSHETLAMFGRVARHLASAADQGSRGLMVSVDGIDALTSPAFFSDTIDAVNELRRKMFYVVLNIDIGVAQNSDMTQQARTLLEGMADIHFIGAERIGRRHTAKVTRALRLLER